MLGVGGEPYEVVYDLLVALARVGLIDGGVHVLDVDDEGMDDGSHFLQVAARHVQTCLHRKLPSFRALPAKLLDEGASQERFASTEADAASRSEEVEIVHLHVLHQEFCVRFLPYVFGFKALRIEAVLAM